MTAVPMTAVPSVMYEADVGVSDKVEYVGYLYESHMNIGPALRNDGKDIIGSSKNLDGINPSCIQPGRQYFVLNGTSYCENNDDLELYFIFSLPQTGNVYKAITKHFSSMLNTFVPVELYQEFLRKIEDSSLESAINRRLTDRKHKSVVSIYEMVSNAVYFDSLHSLSHPQVFYVGTAT